MSSFIRLGDPFVFRDRRHAGAALARALDQRIDEDAVVAGLAAGGVVVAARVARALGLPLDVVAVHKVTHPLQPEHTLGVLAPGTTACIRRRDGVTDDQLEISVAVAQSRARARDRRLRGGGPQPSFDGRTVVLVDDVLTSGASMVAAARWAVERGAGRVVAAAPVAARAAVDLVRREVDEVVCPYTVDELGAPGLWYVDYPDVGDEQVAELLRAVVDPRPALVAP